MRFFTLSLPFLAAAAALSQGLSRFDTQPSTHHPRAAAIYNARQAAHNLERHREQRQKERENRPSANPAPAQQFQSAPR